MRTRYFVCACISLAMCLLTLTAKADESRRFSSYVLDAVATLEKTRAKGGYDINSFFTKDLEYGDNCCVKANNPPVTMCVAAVVEIIIEALNSYSEKNGDNSVFQTISLNSWVGGTRRDIRPYIFMYSSVSSRGTVSALERFSIGTSVEFGELEAGDFINFSRGNGSGHAAVFLSYIDRNGNDLDSYSKEGVAGFRYFSAQG